MKYLSGKEKKQLNDKLPKGYIVDKKDEITEKDNVLFKDKEPFLIIRDGNYLPHLKSVPQSEYKSVYVDKGAIPFILKGATLMKPGIQRIEDGFENGEIILIKDETHNKTIAIGFALLSSNEMKEQSSGKSVDIYHFVSDSFY